MRSVITLRPRKNGRHFADDIFRCIFVNEKFCILIKISLNFVPTGPIDNISALVQIMAWRCPGAKPLSEPMMVSLLTHICVTRPQWVILNCLILSVQPLKPLACWMISSERLIGLPFLIGFTCYKRRIMIWTYDFMLWTHCGLMMPYGDTDLGQHWLR